MSKRNENKYLIGQCIYCNKSHELSDEHIIPFGLGGKLILEKASCKECAKITGSLEQKLLRGHWWPYRKKLGIKTRSKFYPTYRPVTLKHHYRAAVPAQIKSDDYPLITMYEFDPPSILTGKKRSDTPFATRVLAKIINPMPNRILVDGKVRLIEIFEEIEFPVNSDAKDFALFLAKVAHCYAIYIRGLNACDKYFLPEFILGNGDGLLTYVGNASSSFLGPFLPGTGINRMLDRVQGSYLSVYIQIFCDSGDPPPIYEVIVGNLNR